MSKIYQNPARLFSLNFYFQIQMNGPFDIFAPLQTHETPKMRKTFFISTKFAEIGPELKLQYLWALQFFS